MQESSVRSALVTGAIIEGVLFALFLASFPLIHAGPVGIVGVILSFPQTPGLIVAGVLADLAMRLFGSMPSLIGVPLFFGAVFLVQWLLVTVIVAAWRAYTSSGPWSPSLRGGA